MVETMRLDEIQDTEPNRNMGDLTSLKESLSEVGLLSPLIIDTEKHLLAGRRRYRAMMELGWSECEVLIIDTFDIFREKTNVDVGFDAPKALIKRLYNLTIQMDENKERKNLTDAESRREISEYDDIMREIYGSQPSGGDRRSEEFQRSESERWSQRKTAEKRQIGVGQVSEAKTARNFEDENPELKELDLPTPIITEIRKAELEIQPLIIAETIEQVRKGTKVEHKDIKRTIKEKRKEKTVLEFDITAVSESIVLDSIENLIKYVEPDSVDLILTDPPYPKEYLPLWKILFEKSLECLKEGGILVAYTPHIYIPEICAMIPDGLNYVWTIAQIHSGPAATYHPSKVNIRWKPILVFVKGNLPEHIEYYDDIITGAGREKDGHEWQQALGEAEELIERFSRIGDLVVEPFLGSGTTVVAAKRKNRSFFGMDIDAACLVITTKRLEEINDATS